MDYDLAFEMAMIRMEKEDIILNALTENVKGHPDHRSMVDVPKIWPYMWESERFTEKFIELMTTEFRLLKDADFLNDFAQRLGLVHYNFMGLMETNEYELTLEINKRKDFLGQIVEAYGSDDIKVFYKLNN